MDDIVKKAMAKWPNVPNCYGWLGLDARGAWRMRDERAQHLNLAGEKVIQQALLGFINRNYAADERGCWYFQNGPQRVYLNLEATPFIARTDPALGLVLHTGAAVEHLGRALMTDSGAVILVADGKVAQLDDRDLAQLMASIDVSGDQLMAWLEGADARPVLHYRGQLVALERIAQADLASAFGFVRLPQPSA